MWDKITLFLLDSKTSTSFLLRPLTKITFVMLYCLLWQTITFIIMEWETSFIDIISSYKLTFSASLSKETHLIGFYILFLLQVCFLCFLIDKVGEQLTNGCDTSHQRSRAAEKNWSDEVEKKKNEEKERTKCDVINVSDVTKTSIKVSRKRVGKMRGILTLKKCTFIKIWSLEQNNCYEQGFLTGVSSNFSRCAAKSFMS